MFNFFCCKRRKLDVPNTKKEIKLDLNMNKDKEGQSLEINQSQSQSMSILSNNLNNSTKDNILQKQKKFNIVQHINNLFEISKLNQRT